MKHRILYVLRDKNYADYEVYMNMKKTRTLALFQKILLIVYSFNQQICISKVLYDTAICNSHSLPFRQENKQL